MTMEPRLWRSIVIAAGLTLASACSEGATTVLQDDRNEDRSYIVMHEDLAELKADFNAASDKVRLFFIVGPT